MQQGWVQVAGLVADISGFGLIVSEWWNAVIRERAVIMVNERRMACCSRNSSFDWLVSQP